MSVHLMYLIVTPSLELNALIRIQRTPAQSLTLSQSYQTSLIFNPNFVSQVSFPVLLLDKKFPHCNWVDCYITEFINKQSFFFFSNKLFNNYKECCVPASHSIILIFQTGCDFCCWWREKLPQLITLWLVGQCSLI